MHEVAGALDVVGVDERTAREAHDVVGPEPEVLDRGARVRDDTLRVEHERDVG